MFRRILSISFIICIASILHGQDYSWWNLKHNWDGFTPWSDYLIVSPAFMGPNALPVPEVRKGFLPEERTLELGLDGHYSKGDQTGNLFSELYFPLFSTRIGLGISYAPVEYYRTDTVTRDLRRSREYEPSGYSLGDIYFSTFIHLLEETESRPGVLITVNLKTASGTGFVAARHTDAPAYSFDISTGKKLFTGESIVRYIRAYAMIGFYVYQTNLVNYMQNDAFQYGAGFDINFGKFQVEQQLGGYAGYIGNGDKPMVYRLNMTWYSKMGLDLKVRFQQGFIDFPYSSLRLSALISI